MNCLRSTLLLILGVASYYQTYVRGSTVNTLSTDLIPVKAVVNNASRLYELRSDLELGRHLFYPLMYFTCSGRIDVIVFVAEEGSPSSEREHGQQSYPQFSVWSPYVQYNNHYSRQRDYVYNSNDLVSACSTNQLYCVNTTSRNMNFNERDIFGIRQPGSQYSELNVVHQNGGGFNQYIPLAWGNFWKTWFEIPASRMSSYPLVGLITSRPQCVRGFLNETSLLRASRILQDVNTTTATAAQNLISLNTDDQNLLFPYVIFNTTGILRRWIFAAKFNLSSIDNWPKFQVWRRNNSLTNEFFKIGGSMTKPEPTGFLNVYQIEVSQSDSFTVCPGDVLGLNQPMGQFSLTAFNLNTRTSSERYLIFDPSVGNFRCCGSAVSDNYCNMLPLISAEIQVSGPAIARNICTLPTTSTDGPVDASATDTTAVVTDIPATNEQDISTTYVQQTTPTTETDVEPMSTSETAASSTSEADVSLSSPTTAPTSRSLDTTSAPTTTPDDSMSTTVTPASETDDSMSTTVTPASEPDDSTVTPASEPDDSTVTPASETDYSMTTTVTPASEPDDSMSTTVTPASEPDDSMSTTVTPASEPDNSMASTTILSGSDDSTTSEAEVSMVSSTTSPTDKSIPIPSTLPESETDNSMSTSPISENENTMSTPTASEADNAMSTHTQSAVISSTNIEPGTPAASDGTTKGTTLEILMLTTLKSPTSEKEYDESNTSSQPATNEPHISETTTKDTKGSANQASNGSSTVIGTVVGLILLIMFFLSIVALVAVVYLLKRRMTKTKKLSTTAEVLLSNHTYDNCNFESNSQKREHVPLTSFSTTCTQLYDDPQEILPNLDHNSASTDHIYHILEANNSDLGRKECTTSEPVVDYECGPAHTSLPTQENQRWGVYVPTLQQRNVLGNSSENVYQTLEENQYALLEAAPSQANSQIFFEESDTYWKPALDQEGLYEQLANKKYREILTNQIQITDQLGSGQFGTVSKGVWQLPGGHSKDVAVKTLQEGATEVDKIKFLQEAAINGQFMHPNVVKLMGVVTIGEPVMIVLEFISNGNLKEFLMKLQPIPGELVESNTPHVLLRFCKEIASGMKYLSGKHFVHRDLAARNVLVSAEKNCKISDFGMSRDLEDETYYVAHGGKIPVKWTAPEAIHYSKYSTASDVWSFGAVMYEIWSLGHKPFEEDTNRQVLRKVDKGYRLPPPPGCPKEMYRLMIQCWNPDKSSRPTFSCLHHELSKSPYSFNLTDESSTELHPQSGVLGAPLEAGKNLYLGFQNAYIRRHT